MFNRNRKSVRIISTVIILVIVLAMLSSVLLYLF